MNDTGSLQNLNDIVLPAPVPWWPLAPGWYILAAILLVLLVVLALRGWRRWRRNAYRRQALARVAAMRAGQGELGDLPAVLKQTAMCVWPRRQVAALCGPDWHDFLDSSGAGGRFGDGAGGILDRLSYGGAAVHPPDAAERLRLLDAAETWLRRHAAPPAEGGA